MKKYKLLPFPVIRAAASGDNEAMSRVVQHYSGYISKLCMRPFYDKTGNQHYIVDEAMHRELEAKLTSAVLHFRVA